MPDSSHPFPTVDELDRDGALRETAEKAGVTRAAFMRRMGAFAGGGLLLGSVSPAFALAQGTASSDIAILNYALTLEYLEATFYDEAVAKGALSGETATFAQVVADHENAHVKALQGVLGSKAVSKPSFDFKGTTSDQSAFQKTSMAVEDLGVSAYEGQATNIKSTAVLKAAASILPVEARHAAWMRDIIGHGSDPSPAPDAFNPAMSMSEVLQAVKATGFITSGMSSAGSSGAVSGQPSMTG